MGDAVQGVCARSGILQSAEQADQGGLACAVLSNQAVDGALGYMDVHTY